MLSIILGQFVGLVQGPHCTLYQRQLYSLLEQQQSTSLHLYSRSAHWNYVEFLAYVPGERRQRHYHGNWSFWERWTKMRAVLAGWAGSRQKYWAFASDVVLIYNRYMYITLYFFINISMYIPTYIISSPPGSFSPFFLSLKTTVLICFFLAF